MKNDIILRKRRYEDLDLSELSMGDRFDAMLERRWTFGTWVSVLAICGVLIYIFIKLAPLFIGLD